MDGPHVWGCISKQKALKQVKTCEPYQRPTLTNGMSYSFKRRFFLFRNSISNFKWSLRMRRFIWSRDSVFPKICVAYCLFLFHDDLKRYIEISLAKIFSVKAASAEVEMFLSLQSKLSKRNISEEMSIDHI